MKPGRFLKIIWFVFKTALKLNLFKTIYFNFKVLPFGQAIKLPFHFYGKTDFAELSGQFKLSAAEIHFGMIVFGGKHEVVITSNVPTRIYNSGTIEFSGHALFARGINIMVWDNAKLAIGGNFSIGSLCRIIIFRNMEFGNNVLISWECQFFDTDFHFIKTDDGEIRDNCAAVSIGNNVWFGARATLLKGTVISENSIIAANSVCSGNYGQKYESGVLLGGIPAKPIKNNVSYLRDKKHEMELYQYFSNHQNGETVWN